jgi:hypothetical protein
MADQAHCEQKQENEEQYLGNARRRKGHGPEAKQARNDRHDKKNQSIVKHGASASGASRSHELALQLISPDHFLRGLEI